MCIKAVSGLVQRGIAVRPVSVKKNNSSLLEMLIAGPYLLVLGSIMVYLPVCGWWHFSLYPLDPVRSWGVAGLPNHLLFFWCFYLTPGLRSRAAAA